MIWTFTMLAVYSTTPGRYTQVCPVRASYSAAVTLPDRPARKLARLALLKGSGSFGLVKGRLESDRVACGARVCEKPSADELMLTGVPGLEQLATRNANAAAAATWRGVHVQPPIVTSPTFLRLPFGVRPSRGQKVSVREALGSILLTASR